MFGTPVSTVCACHSARCGRKAAQLSLPVAGRVIAFTMPLLLAFSRQFLLQASRWREEIHSIYGVPSTEGFTFPTVVKSCMLVCTHITASQKYSGCVHTNTVVASLSRYSCKVVAAEPQMFCTFVIPYLNPVGKCCVRHTFRIFSLKRHFLFPCACVIWLAQLGEMRGMTDDARLHLQEMERKAYMQKMCLYATIALLSILILLVAYREITNGGRLF